MTDKPLSMKIEEIRKEAEAAVNLDTPLNVVTLGPIDALNLCNQAARVRELEEYLQLALSVIPKSKPKIRGYIEKALNQKEAG
jgi:hypothetical protein